MDYRTAKTSTEGATLAPWRVSTQLHAHASPSLQRKNPTEESTDVASAALTPFKGPHRLDSISMSRATPQINWIRSPNLPTGRGSLRESMTRSDSRVLGANPDSPSTQTGQTEGTDTRRAVPRQVVSAPGVKGGRQQASEIILAVETDRMRARAQQC